MTPSSFSARRARLFLSVLCGVILISSALAAGKKAFDIPAATADKSLKQFTAQSGAEVVYVAEVVRGVSTLAVKGSLTPAEAIQQLLAGSPLSVKRDERSNVFMISRDPNGERAAPKPVSDRPLANPPVETTSVRTARPAGEDKAIVLSPFEVTTDQDTGFAATSSLAGGRLAGELRDTPVAYSVMTREFIDALGIVDLFEASEWSTGNTERLTPGNIDFFGNTGEYMTRGFISTGANTGALRQRNFFPASNYGDSYNLERYDFGRGPNSILF
ncbi:MAG: hypothetical protein ACREH8_15275, partial [Opitutaceae bacterium]